MSTRTTEVLVTSPLLFCHRGRRGRLTAFDAWGGGRFRLPGSRAAEIVTAFLEPRTLVAAEAAGFTAAELAEAREAGILVGGDECERLDLWERNNWSRPAYLLFSQIDVPFQEAPAGVRTRVEMVERRRDAVRENLRHDPCPAPGLLSHGAEVELPAPPAISRDLASLTSRRSVRAFSPHPPTAEHLAGTLHAATAMLRDQAPERTGVDPVGLLASFFAWAHLFVVVQDVEGIAPGAYEYDWVGHRLVTSARPPSDTEVLASIQGQRGILGGGWVTYLVADLRSYAWLYRNSRGYLSLLVQAGALAQELLMAGAALQLGGWTSPAVHESRAAALLGLKMDDAIEVLSIVKLGRPLRPLRR